MVLVLSLIQLQFSLYIQDVLNRNGLSRYELTHFHFSADAWGLAVRELILPIAMVYIISNFGFFRRAALDKWQQGDKLLLFFALAIAQCLVFAFSYSLATRWVEQVSFGFFLVIVAGYIGGWSMGLSLGVLSFVLIGSIDLIQYPPEAGSMWQHFYRYFVLSEAASVAIWIGTVAGLLASLFGKFRYLPIVAFLLGGILKICSRYFIVIPAETPHDVIEPILPISLLTAIALTIVALLLRNLQVIQSRKQAEDAQLALAEAELRALRAQINPHFFFNALNTIRYFVRVEPEQARSLLLDVSEVFKKTLQAGEFVPLRDEITYVESYLNIEKARLQERLEISWALPSDSLLDIPVPTLCLQTIIENAVIHGIAPKADGGELNISVEVWDDILHITVRDNGVGFDVNRRAAWKDSSKVVRRDKRKNSVEDNIVVQLSDKAIAEGVKTEQPKVEIDKSDTYIDIGKGLEKKVSIGLKNVEERLLRYYGDAFPLRIESEAGVGTRVQMRIPIGDFAESSAENS